MKRINPTLVVSEWAPPLVGGGPTIMRSLLKHFPKGSYSILTRRILSGSRHLDLESTLDCKYYTTDLPPFLLARRNIWYLDPLLECLLILWVAVRGLSIVRKNGTENILATTYGGFEVAALLIHRIARKKLFIYLFDIYEESQLTRWSRFKARVTEPRLIHSAEKVFVMSEFLKEHIESKYGIVPIFIPHAIDSSFKYNHVGRVAGLENKPFTVVYTGMVYAAQIDGVLNMVEVANTMPLGKMLFMVYSPQSVESLDRMGIRGPNVLCGFVTSKDIPAVQQEADVLFLSLSFNSPYPLVIKTASPGKIAEYLAASRPIIVSAPDDSYMSHYARSKGFGIVVNNPDPAMLREAILRLMNEEDLRCRLIDNARKTACEHEGRILSERLQNYLA